MCGNCLAWACNEKGVKGNTVASELVPGAHVTERCHCLTEDLGKLWRMCSATCSPPPVKVCLLKWSWEEISLCWVFCRVPPQCVQSTSIHSYPANLWRSKTQQNSGASPKALRKASGRVTFLVLFHECTTHVARLGGKRNNQHFKVLTWGGKSDSISKVRFKKATT